MRRRNLLFVFSIILFSLLCSYALSEFDQEIEFSFESPNLTDVQQGYHRDYSLARIHNGQFEKIPVTIANGRWSGKTGKVSDFVLLYEDQLSSNSVYCEITAPESAQVGKECTITYAFMGGSGNYSNMTLLVAALGEMPGGGSDIGSKYYSLENSSGTFTFICPAGSSALIWLNCHDDVTGEDYWEPYIISLEQNPDFPVTFAYDKEEYFVGDSITITYEIDGQGVTLVNSRVLWGLQNNGNTIVPIETQVISSTKGSVTYQPTYGDYVMLFLQAEDDNGNLIFGQSKTIRIKTITPEMAQKLPNSLTRIESEAFAGTAFVAIDIPASVTFIDEYAFDGSKIRLIVGHNEYSRIFALKHGITYIGQ